MAVNQTPGFNFDWKIIYGQMGWVGNRGQAELAEMNVPHQRVQPLLVYHCGLHISVFLSEIDKIKGTRFKNKNMVLFFCASFFPILKWGFGIKTELSWDFFECPF